LHSIFRIVRRKKFVTQVDLTDLNERRTSI